MMKSLVIVLYTALVWWCNIPSTLGMSSNETDRLALLAFKAAIDDQASSFGALSSWNDSVHYCDWNGILCSRRHRDRVVQLNLTSKGLVGSLSPHIGNLSFLRRIILSNNSFHGPIPEEIGRLFRLQVILLSNNSFGGGIPKNLSRCSHLEILYLNHNHLSGNIPSQLGDSLPKLQEFSLNKNNNISGTIPPSFGNLSLLDGLFFQDCDLQGEIPEGISKLRRLTYLIVGENKLSEYGMGDVASTLGDVYSFGVLLLEMFTGKRPTDNMFKDHLNLHTFVKNALPDRVMDIVDPCIQLEHNNGSWINDCMVSILTIGVACSSESPRDRMEMGTIVSKLCKIKAVG